MEFPLESEEAYKAHQKYMSKSEEKKEPEPVTYVRPKFCVFFLPIFPQTTHVVQNKKNNQNAKNVHTQRSVKESLHNVIQWICPHCTFKWNPFDTEICVACLLLPNQTFIELKYPFQTTFIEIKQFVSQNLMTQNACYDSKQSLYKYLRIIIAYYIITHDSSILHLIIGNDTSATAHNELTQKIGYTSRFFYAA